MNQFPRNKWQGSLIFILLIIFTLLKISELTLPYFWDESGVYARAALFQHDHTLSLLPSALPPELSRGHPLLWSFIYGLSFDLFGDSVVTGHITSLVISLVLLFTVYSITKKYFNKNSALFATFFLMVQPVFYAQSALVLPEILLSLLFILSVFFWVEKKYAWYALASAAAIMTKETAIILPFVVISGEFLLMLTKRRKLKFKAAQLFIFFPLIVFGSFLLIQKQQNGWYLFPMHENSINLSPHAIQDLFCDYASFMFVEQGRAVATILIILFFALIIFKKIQVKVEDFTVFLIVLIIGGMLFSSLNFYMNRYTTFIVVSFSVIVGVVVNRLGEFIRYFRIFIALGCIIPFLYIESTEFNYDADLGYKKYIDVQQDAVDYAIQTIGSNDSLFVNFPVVYAFHDSRMGYCDTSDLKFELASKYEMSGARYFLIANPGSYDHQLPKSDNLEALKEFRNSVAVITLYQLKSP